MANHISFVRAIPPPRVVTLAGTPSPVQIDLSRTALIIVDMQNDFLHPEGWFPARGISPAPLLPAIPKCEQAAKLARAHGVPVIWLNWGVRPDCGNIPPGILERGNAYGNNRPGYAEPSKIEGRGRILVRGDWGSQTLDDFTVDEADYTVHKHRLSGFWDSELDALLRRLQVSTLLFAGVNIDRCVFSTLQDASFLGYDCILLEDACATPSPDFVIKGVMYLLHLLYGVSATCTDLENALAADTPDTTAASISS
ncbi:Isochorismatase-like protein [Limtongia smithiae]|uniref:Isochorismatase-like protein n=1 Tax=Limtongia smithiae TaxID=1125753 RepID=UPI0034CFC557